MNVKEERKKSIELSSLTKRRTKNEENFTTQFKSNFL